jgi:hypothetical protein
MLMRIPAFRRTAVNANLENLLPWSVLGRRQRPKGGNVSGWPWHARHKAAPQKLGQKLSPHMKRAEHALAIYETKPILLGAAAGQLAHYRRLMEGQDDCKQRRVRCLLYRDFQ